MSDSTNGFMICGESGVGKSVSLMNIKNQKGVLYLNCEGGKPLPFKNDFKNMVIDDPKKIKTIIKTASADEEKRFHTVVVDTASFMMERFEALHVIGAEDTYTGWSEYAQFFKSLIYEQVAGFHGSVIFLAHLDSWLDESVNIMRTTVPVKGSLKKNGLEAYFTTVINCRKVKIKDLADYDNDKNKLLNITQRDRDLGYKHVFQTRTTKETIGDRVRTPLGLFTDDETFIDNDAQSVIDRLVSYYS